MSRSTLTLKFLDDLELDRCFADGLGRKLYTTDYTVGRSYPNAGEKLPSGASYKLENLEWNNLSDNDVINVEPGLGLEILFTPGHADDHVCLWLEADNVLFAGDNILGGSTTVFDNYFEYMKSLIRIGSRICSSEFASIVCYRPTHK